MSAASSTDTNSITQPTNIVPETSTATGLGTSFDYTFAGYSITVIELQADNPPTVAQAAAASPAPPVTITSTSLSVLGADAAGESNLTYTWSATGPANVIFGANGTNAAKNVSATFLESGTYNFLVTITNPLGGTTTSSLTVVVAQTPTHVAVTPNNSPLLPIGFSQLFSGTATDQFGFPISSPSFTWGITGSSNSINSSGNATLGSTPGSFLVTATDGSAQGSAVIIAENFAVPSGSTLGINLGSGGAVSLSNTGSTLTAAQNGEQISFTGVAAVTVTDTGSGDTFNFTGPSSIPFTFSNASTSTINVNAGSLTFASAASITLGALNIASGATSLLTPSATNTPNVLNITSLLVSGTGKLDMTNSEIFVKYGAASDPISTIYGYLKTGYNGGAWNGPGIISSSAAAQNASAGALQYGIGWADGNDGVHNVPGLSTGQIELRYTLLGDANLDGRRQRHRLQHPRRRLWNGTYQLGPGQFLLRLQRQRQRFLRPLRQLRARRPNRRLRPRGPDRGVRPGRGHYRRRLIDIVHGIVAHSAPIKHSPIQRRHRYGPPQANPQTQTPESQGKITPVFLRPRYARRSPPAGWRLSEAKSGLVGSCGGLPNVDRSNHRLAAASDIFRQNRSLFRI